MFLNGELVAEGWYDRGTTEDATGPLELVAGESYLLVMEMYENGGGATAYLRWEGPGMPKEIIPQGALVPPQMAFSLTPSNGATGLGPMPTLSWMAGDSAVLYDVYLSKDEALVAAGDASVLVSQQPETSYAVADALGRGTTWFWKVDVITADGTVLPGLVSSFRIADENTENWATGVQAAEPAYLDTYVQDGLYDIGTFGGEQTYEFIVNSNPDETEASMCLIGRRQFGDTQVGLKYEQWNNTGTYGATVFGVVDLDYGVPTTPGEYTHLVFVSSEATGTTELYVNGVLEGSVDSAISLSGLVGIGYGAQGEDMTGSFDNFDGDIFGVAIYDRALTVDEIAANADKYFNPIPITDPDLLLYLDFESGAGSIALDQSGHSNHGMFVGDPQWATGIFGGAVDLDGDGDYVDCGNDPMFSITDAFTLSVWINWRATGATWQTVIAKGDNAWRLARGADTQTMDFGFTAGGDRGWQAARTVTEVPLGEWHHVTATYDTIDGAKIYLDGVLEGTNSDTAGITVGDYPVLIGENAQATGRYWNGLIDEVRVYSKTLTDVEIAMLVGKPYVEDFESYEVGTDLHGVNDWEGWQGAAGAGAPVSDAFASSGSNSVEIIGTADLVKKLDITGGTVTLTAMQYIPSGTSGDTFFILMNQYDPNPLDWSCQSKFSLGSGQINDGGGTIVYDQWVELKYVIDLDNNTVDEYYNGEVIRSGQWDNDGHNTLQAIDLFSAGASSVYYDDITIGACLTPVGQWPLDDGAGAVAVDLSGNGNDGIINNPNGGLGPDGSVWVDDPERGTVISFNGTADGAFIRAGNIPQMTLTNDFTWAFWAKHSAENTADNDIILGNRMDENAVDFVPRQFIKFTPTKFEWHMNGNGDDNLEYEDIPADVWLHHAVVKTADQLVYYRNGIEASSGTITQALDFPQPLFFGGDNEGSEGENWAGLMSDVRIYDCALSAIQIYRLANP
jgi:hypothetical protein